MLNEQNLDHHERRKNNENIIWHIKLSFISYHEFSKLYLRTEVKITVSDVVLNTEEIIKTIMNMREYGTQSYLRFLHFTSTGELTSSRVDYKIRTSLLSRTTTKYYTKKHKIFMDHFKQDTKKYPNNTGESRKSNSEGKK